MKTLEEMHYDQKYFYEMVALFMEEIGSEGMEVTNEDCMDAFLLAKHKTNYFKE